MASPVGGLRFAMLLPRPNLQLRSGASRLRAGPVSMPTVRGMTRSNNPTSYEYDRQTIVIDADTYHGPSFQLQVAIVCSSRFVQQLSLALTCMYTRGTILAEPPSVIFDCTA